MTMASEAITSRLSNSAEKPRPPVPSRTSSLKYFRPGAAHEKGNLSTCTSSASAKTLGETPASSWGHAKSVLRQSLIADDGPLLEIANSLVATSLRRSYTSKGPSSGIKLNRRSASCSATMRSPMSATKVKRWAGLTRTVSDWDGLRRDPELWFEDGDCFVHLYARGQSRRGPSFRVPFKALRQSKCGAMFSLCFAQTTPAPGLIGNNTRRVSSGFSTPVTKTNMVELYIPAPEDASKEASFQWHITTRNFFAFVFGKPLVGSHLGQALVGLQERMQLFRSGQIDNCSEFLEYAEDQGYRDFVDCSDYALAMLYYAEHCKLRDVWIDAFVHCVGMNESLTLSQEFAPISRLTKALITRAYLEMDIHLGRVQVALNHFLEDDFSPAFLGLSDGGRAHLDRFRSFLHSFYVEKFGYWPPPKGVPFSKALYRSMYYDFQKLYDYLVDLESTADLTTQKPASGGICVLQNVESFDKRHDFIPLPHPLPLLPQYEPLAKKTQSQKALRTLTLGSKQAKTDRYMTTRAALTTATNSRDISVTSCAIVQAYMRFERQCALNQREEKVSMTDARKVRWILIYGTLQYLISAIRAPKEVRDTEGPEYPLCCLVTEQSPWQVGTKVLISPGVTSVNVPDAINSYLSESNCEDPNQSTCGALTIQPDCQTDDYFTHTNPDATPVISRPVSVEVPAPLRISTPIVQNNSVRSLRRLSLSARSSRRNSVVGNAPQSYCEILVHGYGNGLNEAVVDPPSQTVSRTQSTTRSKRSSNSTLPEGAGPETSWLRPSTPDHPPRHAKRPSKLDLKSDAVLEQARTPCFDSFQMDQLVSPMASDELPELPSSSDSTASAESPFWSDEASSTSSKSSAHGEPTERKNSVEDSGLLGGLVRVDTPITSPKRSPTLKAASPVTPTPNRRDEFRFSFNNQSVDQFDISHFGSSPTSATDLTIGVALSGPSTPSAHAPPPPPVAALSFDVLPLLEQKPRRPLSRSFSTDSLPPLSPLRMNPLNSLSLNLISGSKKEKVSAMDIFSALSLAPKEAQDKEESTAGRKGSECSRSILEAIPPPISKTPKIDMKKVVEEAERGRKKEKRKSFWRR